MDQTAPAAPTERELEILKILWDIGPATVRQVWDVLRQRDDLAQNTVQTFLRLMEDKGLVQHELDGRSFVYRPLYSRQRSVTRFLQRVFDGSANQLVQSLLSSRHLSPAELEGLEALIRQEKQRRGM
jgi:predicted transcriptional regulator